MSVKKSLGLHDCTFAAGSGLTRVLGPFHLGNHELKILLYVLVVARAGFGPRAFELRGEGAAVFGRDLALFGAEVGFVAYDDDGDPVDGLLKSLVRNVKGRDGSGNLRDGSGSCRG